MSLYVKDPIVENYLTDMGNLRITEDPQEVKIIDDRTVQLNTEQDIESLKYRFQDAVADMICHTDGKSLVTVRLAEDKSNNSATLSIAGNYRFEDDVGMFKALQSSLAQIASAVTDQGREPGYARLKYIVLRCYEPRTLTAIRDLHKEFEKHSKTMDALVDMSFGFADDVLDTDEANYVNHLLGLRNLISYIVGNKNKNLNLRDIVKDAVTVMLHQNTGMVPLIMEDGMHQSLRQKIFQVSKPKWVFNTLSRLAKDFKTFTALRIHTTDLRVALDQSTNIPPASSSSSSSSSSPPASISTPGSRGPVKPTTSDPGKHVPFFRRSDNRIASRRGNGINYAASFESVEKLMSLVKPFLEMEDRNTGFRLIKPSAKQSTVLLLGCLLQGINPPPESEAYYDLGYVVCRTSDEQQLLGGLYKDLFQTCGKNVSQKTAIFKRFWQAVASNKLAMLILQCGYQVFQKTLPELEKYLEAPKIRRPSVWRLIQFMRSNRTEPTGELARDFGFRNCKGREDVEAMKTIYAKALECGTPQGLDKARQSKKLLEFVTSHGAPVQEREKRLFTT